MKRLPENPQRSKSLLLSAVLFFGVMFGGALAAETRVYQSSKPVHEFIPTFIDQLSGVQFKIVRQFNERTDGKLGFVLSLMPGQRYCEISFLEGGGKGTILQVSTQDRTDENFFNRIAVKLGMTEPGVHPVQDGSSPWPASGRQ